MPIRYISWWIDITHLQCILAPRFSVDECAKTLLSEIGFKAEVESKSVIEQVCDEEIDDEEDALMELFDLINDTIIEENQAKEEECMSNAVVKDGKLIKYNGNDSYVRIPDSITSIGRCAFHNNSNLIGIDIPDSVTEIEEHAFDGCKNLTEVHIPEGVKEISARTFQYCTSLRKLTIPSTVNYIGHYALYNCESLGIIRYQGTYSEWDRIEWGERVARMTDIITLECTDEVCHDYLFIRY